MASAFLLKYQTKVLTLTETDAVPSITLPSSLGAPVSQNPGAHAQTQSAAVRSAAANVEIDHEKI